LVSPQHQLHSLQRSGNLGGFSSMQSPWKILPGARFREGGHGKVSITEGVKHLADELLMPSIRVLMESQSFCVIARPSGIPPD
jgi:hypothetical protein